MSSSNIRIVISTIIKYMIYATLFISILSNVIFIGYIRNLTINDKTTEGCLYYSISNTTMNGNDFTSMSLPSGIPEGINSLNISDYVPYGAATVLIKCEIGTNSLIPYGIMKFDDLHRNGFNRIISMRCYYQSNDTDQYSVYVSQQIIININHQGIVYERIGCERVSIMICGYWM